MAISRFFVLKFVYKMVVDGHFGWPKITSITFLAISGQYTTFGFNIWQVMYPFFYPGVS